MDEPPRCTVGPVTPLARFQRVARSLVLDPCRECWGFHRSVEEARLAAGRLNTRPGQGETGARRVRLIEDLSMFQPTEETRDREALEPIQLERLRRTVARIALHNPVYWRHLGGVAAGDLASFDDLGRLPFLTKDQLRDAYPYGMACHGPEPVQRVHMSSGTTGAPIVNPYTAADLDAVARGHGALAGGGGRDGAGRPTGDGVLRSVHWRLRLSLRGRGARGDGDPRWERAGLSFSSSSCGISRRPSWRGSRRIPSRMIEVARQEGFDFRSTKLRVAVLGSEPWSDELRARIESEMGVRTYDLIGMTETGGPGMGIECGPATAFTCGTITICPRSWTRRPAGSCGTASGASSS